MSSPPTPPSDPLTPPSRSPHRMFFDSPFSDYYTESSHSHSSYHSSPLKHFPELQSQIQLALLNKLSQLEQRISQNEPSIRTSDLLHERIDALEAVLTAPESQSRLPADVVDSGLFLEDGDIGGMGLDDSMGSDVTYLMRKIREAQDGNASHNEEICKQAQDLCTNLSVAVKQLQQRFDEIKLLRESTSDSISTAEKTIEDLRESNKKLKLDLSHNQAELYSLKVRLESIKIQAARSDLSSDSEASLERNINQWKEDWKKAEERVKYRNRTSRLRPKGRAGATRRSTAASFGGIQWGTGTISGHSSSKRHTNARRFSTPSTFSGIQLGTEQVSTFSSPKPEFARPSCKNSMTTRTAKSGSCTATKGNSISNISSLVPENSPELSLEPELVKQDNEGHSKVDALFAEICDIIGNDNSLSLSEEDKEEEVESIPEKTPWQELWDGLKEFAGVEQYLNDAESF
ncbi:hypothetical protein M501DRAFT_1001483 [Patellaria atrata CBS 101060]|uniref:Uncharacterized protein n=1 Tax=Patellaria atrata CBS 101060 TaxID=1346257 RepID=A0A9P4S2M5_9PEZI|nr:hypothetical protein M501DRAFT_1001483 [Patellaria atrata CBS 101060]